jgi:hypothetical protein
VSASHSWSGQVTAPFVDDGLIELSGVHAPDDGCDLVYGNVGAQVSGGDKVLREEAHVRRSAGCDLVSDAGQFASTIENSGSSRMNICIDPEPALPLPAAASRESALPT